MIHLTEIAAVALHETLDTISAGPLEGLRLRRDGNRLVLHLDIVNPGDLEIRHQHRLVLIVGPDTRIESEDAVIDAEISNHDPHLVLRKLNGVPSSKDSFLRTAGHTYGMYN